MELKEMFVKPIDRDLKGVIKIGQENTMGQELEEYVVTRELQKHFATFFSHYNKGINHSTDEMGVWISGFFGSGKSHFLKILSHLLRNQEVDGKKPLDFFVEDSKITDSVVLADMKAATQVTRDVILFNIDSKSDSASNQHSKESILSIFLKAFNNQLGFYGDNPHIADLERTLTEENIYEAFKSKFTELSGKSWCDGCARYRFYSEKVSEALVEIGFMGQAAAERTCDSLTEDYHMDLDAFARLVQKHIESKGKNHHVIFMVDEMGQYIGDNRDLMLNLQTVTENLGTTCLGKSWVIVTSQEGIDSITKVKGQDFSKIQGRFDTKLTLSSANVDEVILKRVLEKTPQARSELKHLYEEKESVLKNLLQFNDGIEKKLYSDGENFANVYPFIPYQFDLLQSVLTSIREHGASGKHLAEGERSMLALFKDSTTKKMKETTGVLMPFYMFYDEVAEFLDSEYRKVISKALDSEILNPNHSEDCFEVNVLKVLFLIKYVKEIKSNLPNITTLMIDHVDVDRLALQQKVAKALEQLERQTLILKHGEIYTFLSNQEQEINREINQIAIDSSKLTRKISTLLFDDLYTRKNFTTAYNSQPLEFNQHLDSSPYKNNSQGEFTLSFLTAICDEIVEESALRLRTNDKPEVIVALPDDQKFIDELRVALQIESYLLANTDKEARSVKEQKREEMAQRESNARIFFVDALKNADIFVSGDKLTDKATDYSKRIDTALSRLVSTLYNKQDLMKTPMSETHILETLKEVEDTQTAMEGMTSHPNQMALDKVADFIARKSQGNGTTNLKQVMDAFMKAPYGFSSSNVQWLVAKLYKQGDITFTKNKESLLLGKVKPSELLDLLTHRKSQEQLILTKREKAGEQEKKIAVKLLKNLFDLTPPDKSDDAIVSSFQAGTERLLRDMKEWEDRYYRKEEPYPAFRVVKDGKALLLMVVQCESTQEFFKLVKNRENDFADFSEDLEDVSDFFHTGQLKIWEDNNKLLTIYKESENYISHPELISLAKQLTDVQRDPDPFGKIQGLVKLQEDYRAVYAQLLDAESVPVLQRIKEGKERVLEELEGDLCEKQFQPLVKSKFSDLEQRASTSNNIAHLKNIISEVDAVKTRFLNDISAKESQLQAEELAKQQVELLEEPEEVPSNQEESTSKNTTSTTVAEEKNQTATTTSTVTKPVPPPPPKKQQVYVGIGSLNKSTTWRISSKEDVQKYLQELGAELEIALEKEQNGNKNAILNVEF